METLDVAVVCVVWVVEFPFVPPAVVFPVAVVVASLSVVLVDDTVVAVFPCVAEYDKSYVVARATSGAISSLTISHGCHPDAKVAETKSREDAKTPVGRIATTVDVLVQGLGRGRALVRGVACVYRSTSCSCCLSTGAAVVKRMCGCG